MSFVLFSIFLSFAACQLDTNQHEALMSFYDAIGEWHDLLPSNFFHTFFFQKKKVV